METLLKPGIYDSALAWLGKAGVESFVMTFEPVVDVPTKPGEVRGRSEIDADGYVMTLNLWPVGHDDVEGRWAQSAADNPAAGDDGTIVFERLDDGRFYGLKRSRGEVAALWVLSRRD